MEISGTTYTASINAGYSAPRPSPRTPVLSDSVATSKEVQVLSRHLPALKENLAPRASVIDRFSGFADQPLDLDDRSIDRILEGLTA